MRAFAAVLTLTTVLLACGGEAGDEAQESATQVAVGGGIDFERTASGFDGDMHFCSKS